MRLVDCRCVYLVVISAGILAAATSQAEGQFDQFRAEAISNWTLLKKDTSRPLSVKSTMRKVDSISKNAKDIAFVLKQNRDSYLFEITTPSGIKGDRLEHKEVQSSNSKYSFIAKDQGSGWVLSSFDDSPERSEKIRDTAKKLGFNYLDLAFTVGGHTFPEAFDAPGFKMIKYSENANNQPGTSELVFTIPMTANPTKDLKIGFDSAKVYFDTNNKCRISRFDGTLPAKMQNCTVGGLISYRTQDGFIDKYQQTARFGDRYQTTVVISTDSIELRDVPEKEFSLSAYGLPEPEGVVWEKPATPLYVWLLSAAAILAVLAVAFRTIQRRWARASSHIAPPQGR